MTPLTACADLDYTLRKDNFDRQSRKGNTLAALNYNRGLGVDPYTIELNRAKAHRGYALQTPIYRDDKGMKTHFTVSRTKEYRWFSGMQFSFEF